MDVDVVNVDDNGNDENAGHGLEADELGQITRGVLTAEPDMMSILGIEGDDENGSDASEREHQSFFTAENGGTFSHHSSPSANFY